MKTAEWFACLDFGSFDILIPQEQVQSGSYACSLKDISLDHILGKLFYREKPVLPAHGKTLLSLNGGALTTGAPLALVQLEEESFAEAGELLALHLGRLGITAIRFTEEKIQYVLNAAQFIKLWEGKHDKSPPC